MRGERREARGERREKRDKLRASEVTVLRIRPLYFVLHIPYSVHLLIYGRRLVNGVINQRSYGGLYGYFVLCAWG